MGKRLINLLTILLILVLIALSILIGLNFSQLSKELQIRSPYAFGNEPLYHFMVIVDGSDQSFVREMKGGLDKAAEDYNIVFELWDFEGDAREQKILEQMDIGIESGVDGIVVQVFEDPGFEELLIKAKRLSVPIITLANDVPYQEKVSFFSYNKYQMGSRVGRILHVALEESQEDDGTIIILQNSTLFDKDQALAIQEEVGARFKVEPVKVAYQSENIINAEVLTKSILDEYEDIRAIICLSGQETLGVIQALKEANKINQIKVIGSDDEEIILDYVNRGVILATIVADNERIGYEALFDLMKHIEGLFVSQYRDIDVQIISKENLEAYLERIGGERK